MSAAAFASVRVLDPQNRLLGYMTQSHGLHPAPTPACQSSPLSNTTLLIVADQQSLNHPCKFLGGGEGLCGLHCGDVFLNGRRDRNKSSVALLLGGGFEARFERV